jgi:hypothetical protein
MKAIERLWKSNINKILCPFSVENIRNNSDGSIYDQFECTIDELTRQIWVAVSGSTSLKHLGLKLLALCAPPLVPSVISRGAPHQAT